MTIGIFDRYGSRANAGSVTYPDGSFKNETAPGMKNGTPVEQDWANDKEAWFQKLRNKAGIVVNGDVDTIINNQNWNAFLSAISGTAPPSATPADICGGMPDIDWMDPTASPNFLDTGETIRDACVGWDAEYGRPCLFILYGTITISKVSGPWTYGSAPVESPLSPSWGTTPDDVLAICCDADYLYVAWRVTSGNVKLSKFALNPWTGTETFVRDTGYTAFPISGNPAAALCVADSNNIGVLINEFQGGADHQIRIGVWAKDNASFLSEGFTGYDTDFNGHQIISDGTYLYAIGRDESGSPTYDYALLRADIADPTTQADIAIASVSSSNYDLWPTSLCRVRDLVIITDMRGRLYAHQKASASVDIMFGDLAFNEYDSGSIYGSMMCSDGKNLHMHHIVDGASEYHAVMKIPLGEFAIEAIESPVIDVPFSTTRIVECSSIPTNHIMGRMLFDRRDVWVVLYTGEIHRLCQPGS